ncbi:MAG: sensor domain-containing diguanylate cyclase [Ardenticatenaceae bacterium]|nr:sensor domain-containing diguanylate cyclase [Ardenticatenaceae bacterium]
MSLNDWIDSVVVVTSLVTSATVLVTAARYYRHSQRGRTGVAWLLILAGVVCIAISETTEAASLVAGGREMPIPDLFDILAEIALAAGFIRLLHVDLAAERARQTALEQRAQQSESLATAALQLTASLELPEVLHGVARETLALVGADVVAVYRVDSATAGVVSQVTIARRGGDDAEVGPHAPGPLSLAAIRTRRPQIVETVQDYPAFQPRPPRGLASLVAFPLLRKGEAVGTLITGFRQPHHFTEDELHLLAAFAEHAALAMYNAELHRQIEELSVTDPLTGLANRRRFTTKLAAELVRARRYAKPLSLAILDLDNFKSLNDRFGHPAGDAILCAVAQVIRQCVREVDLPARLGGEEFAVILPETDMMEAVVVVERLREQLEATPVTREGQWPKVTLSAGVVGRVGEALPAAPADLYCLADEALYRAKASGRNRVVSAQEERICANSAKGFSEY